MRRALIAGATGLVGSACLNRLLADPEYERVIAVVRRPLAAHPKLEPRIIDFDKLRDLDAFPVDDVFCALGTTIKKAGSQAEFRKVDFEYPKLLAEFGRRCGAGRIALVSSVGADASSSNFYLRVKGETEAAVISTGYESAHIFRPSFLIGERAERRLGEQVAGPAMNALGFLLIGSLRRYRAIPAERVGAAMVTAVKRGLRGIHIYEFDEINALAAG
jgi:uncharacterized protein YbjT (DUF2867 family)